MDDPDTLNAVCPFLGYADLHRLAVTSRRLSQILNQLRATTYFWQRYHSIHYPLRGLPSSTDPSTLDFYYGSLCHYKKKRPVRLSKLNIDDLLYGPRDRLAPITLRAILTALFQQPIIDYTLVDRVVAHYRFGWTNDYRLFRALILSRNADLYTHLTTLPKKPLAQDHFLEMMIRVELTNYYKYFPIKASRWHVEKILCRTDDCESILRMTEDFRYLNDPRAIHHYIGCLWWLLSNTAISPAEVMKCLRKWKLLRECPECMEDVIRSLIDCSKTSLADELVKYATEIGQI